MSQFKETVRDLSGSIVGAAKQTLANYKPSRLFDPNQAFNRIAEQGIANLSYRSPVLADIAQTMLQSVQVEMERKKQQSETIRSKVADGFRGAVAQKLGVDPKSSKVEAEMRRILEKIDKSVDKAGVEETRKATFFKEYEKHFDTMKVAQKSEASAQTPNTNSPESTQTIGGGPEFDGSVLNRIETNTQRTFNALEALASKLALSGGGAGGGGGGSGGASAASFIDPMTGMPSISAAVGSLGGSFLSKIFTDETMEKFAKKAKHFFNVGSDEDTTPEPTATPSPNESASAMSAAVEATNNQINSAPNESASALVKASEATDKASVAAPVMAAQPVKIKRPTSTGIEKKSILDVLGGLNLDLNKSHTSAPIFPTLMPMSAGGKVPESKSSEETTEASLVVKKTSDRTVGVLTEILDELKKSNKDKKSETKLPNGENSTSSIMGGIKKRLPGVKGALGDIASKAKGLIGRGAGIASKGVNAALQVGSKAASYIPVAANAAKGLAGSVIGGVAQAVLPSLVSGGVVGAAGTALGGAALAAGTAALPALAAGGAAATGALIGNKVVNPLLDKGITSITGKENTLGTYLHSLMNEDPDVTSPVSKEQIDAFRAEKASKLPVAAKSASVTAIHAVTAKKDKQDQAEKAKPQAPIIINQVGGGSSAAKPTEAPIILGGRSVRNNESTFERVQMQDFWPRTA